MTLYAIVALFDDYKEARSAVREIEAGVSGAAEISILANNAGARYGTVPQPRAEPGAAEGSLLAGIGAVVIPGVGPAVAAGPTAAVLRRGRGLIAALAAAGVPRAPAELDAEAVRRGATLVAARVATADRDRVSGILASHGPIDLAARAAEWRREGWRGFDENDLPHPGPYYGSAPTLSGAPADHAIAPGRLPESGPPQSDLPLGGKGARKPRSRDWTIRREGPVGADWNKPRVQVFPPAEAELPGEDRG